MTHIVIFRFSSLGDVAMTVPVIRNLLHQYPDVTVTMVSAVFHAPLFDGIERLYFFPADLKGRHKGFGGLFRLFRELQSQRSIHAVADLHNVLRTQVLKVFFQLSGIRWVAQNKGRNEKKELTRAQNKILRPLKSTFQRYADVFAALGYPVQLQVMDGLKQKGPAPAIISTEKENGKRLIGVAPFAQYPRKTYPAEKMKEVLRLLAQHQDVQVYLLGGKADLPLLRQWVNEIKGLELIAGNMSFAEELNFIAHLHAVVSMDSANMHMASLYGVPVVSVWGATHPYAGFYGWGQMAGNAVQIDLVCRPCSVFGNKPGPRQDLACMHGIAPIVVYDRIMTLVYS